MTSCGGAWTLSLVSARVGTNGNREVPLHHIGSLEGRKGSTHEVDLSQQLRELQKSTEELNAATDKANDVVCRTEIFLKEKCRVGGRERRSSVS